MLRQHRWLNRRAATSLALALTAVAMLGLALLGAHKRATLGARVASGRVLFEHVWQPHDPLANGGDGLGPVYNEKSCVACHFQGGTGGGGPLTKNVASFLVRPVASGQRVFESVVHASATRPDLQETFAQLSGMFPIVRGATTTINGCVVPLPDFNPVIAETVNSPALFGAGLIDKLSDWSIHANGLRRSAAGISHDLRGDYSSTPVGSTRRSGIGRVGKFGWKGQFATLEEFVAAACAVELGLTNPRRSQSDPCRFQEDVDAALDMTARQLGELVAFVAELPRPVELLPSDPRERRQAVDGKRVFTEVGCADCHTPDLGDVPGIYSDFRLYELEPDRPTPSYQAPLPELPNGHPQPAEWKTPPLWGVADSAPYFHDGRAPTLHDAIRRHGGDAKKSRMRYEKLETNDRQALLAFLGTLRAPR